MIGTIELSEHVIDAISTAIAKKMQEPEMTKWIPMSVRSPKESGRYLVTFGGTCLVGEDFYSTEEDARQFFEEPKEYWGWRTKNVVAWMPLPKPYNSERY